MNKLKPWLLLALMFVAGFAGGVVVTPGGAAGAQLLQEDGKFLVGGAGPTVRRYTPDGSLDPEFGDAGDQLLVEEALIGKELSFIVLADGHDFVSLVPTRDHKRVFDGDLGPNTGGMGAYS